METTKFRKLLKTTGKYTKILAQHGITSPTDLLRYFPRTYEDRRTIVPLSQLTFSGETEITKGKITKKGMIRTPRGKRLINIQFIDELGKRGQVQALNNQYLLRSTQLHGSYYIIGKPQVDGGKITFWHPELVEAVETTEVAGQVDCIYPVYSDLQGIKSARFGKKIPPLVPQALKQVVDPLPADFYDTYDLYPLRTMLEKLHLPQTMEETYLAKKTLFFKQLLNVQIQSLLNKQTYQDQHTTDSDPSTQPDRALITQFLETLPFELTTAQKRSLKEIIEDIHTPQAMLRLLQGDVGSGKTVVAAAAAWYIIQKRGGQIAFLAPLAVLADQHHKSLAKMLLPLGIRVQLITGATKRAEKEQIKQSLALGHIDLIVGTHALLQEDVQFHDLQLAVIDEQHKFGVKQRAYLQRHESPHLLQMTATPIPRSMALAFFGEFAVSTIDEMPLGRKPIQTKIISEAEFIKLKPWIMTRIAQGQKIFLITPLIEDSEAEGFEDIKSAKAHHAELQQLYAEIEDQIGLLHGRLKAEQKDDIMQKFKDGAYTMLVSTTVIEVGIDIPDATVMIIYNAERFGLSQLHQLRGRVGRSDLQSYCFLETKKKSSETYQRLKHMETTTDGFKLAEIDLQYRGPGEFLGTRQSGDTDIPLEILTDTTLLETVQTAAQDLLENYPALAQQLIDEKESESLLV